MYEFGIVSTFFHHRGHSCSIPVGLQYQFEWVPYLHRDRSIYKIVRNIKSHPSALLNEPRTTITMNLMSNLRTVLQKIFYNRWLQVKRSKRKPSLIRVSHYLLWISHQYYCNKTPEVGYPYQLYDFLFIWMAQTHLHAPFM